MNRLSISLYDESVGLDERTYVFSTKKKKKKRIDSERNQNQKQKYVNNIQQVHVSFVTKKNRYDMEDAPTPTTETVRDETENDLTTPPTLPTPTSGIKEEATNKDAAAAASAAVETTSDDTSNETVASAAPADADSTPSATLQDQFNDVVAWVRQSEMKPTTEEKLTCYAFYKQATVGDVQGSQPWAINFEARAKWDAWNKVKGTTQDEAKKKYIDEVMRQRKKYGF